MARVDANIILRLLTGEPREQAESVLRLFERVAAGQESIVVDEIVIAEVVWTLSSFYRLSKTTVAEALLQLLSRDGVECPGGIVVQRALVLFEERNVDFVDALVGARMLAEGHPEIYSFDRHFDRLEGVRRVTPQ